MPVSVTAAFETDEKEKRAAELVIANMKRRAELFSGTCEIISSPGNGCELAIAIPLPEPVHQLEHLS